ncbi:MAG TPA: hypothetical protein VIX37_11220 [Candidatus Sulfotelmatobacter sp.]
MSTRRVSVLRAGIAFLCAFTAYGQDSQSLGDVARQTRQQKQQKEAQAKDTPQKNASSKQAPGTDAPAKTAQPAKPPHVITNDEIPSHVGPTATSTRGAQTDDESAELPNSGDRDARAEQLKSRIQAQKSAIAGLQSEIDSLNESIHYAGGNCVANCVQWNERQKQKQDQVESMKAQLEEQKKQLENMQDSARKQGFGSSVYEP